MLPLWWLTKDGDKDCLAMYERHYSAYRYMDGRKRTQFVGPGEKVVLRTAQADALWVWRKFHDDSGQTGINCAVFRNESAHLSSELIRQADSIADCLWPGSRHYTYIDETKVKSAQPGYCFLVAGWRRCGRTKGGIAHNGKEANVSRCDTGESTASINRRGDDMQWPRVRAALLKGAELRRPQGLRRYYLHVKTSPSPMPGSLSETRVKTLERAKILRRSGVDAYVLVEQVAA